MDKAARTQRTTGERVFRFFGRLIAGVLVLIIGGYLAVNLVGMAQAHRTKGRLDTALTETLRTQIPAANAHTAAVREAIGTQPVGDWTVQQCAFATNDAGWMVQSYIQECSLVSETIYPASSIAAARRIIAGAGADLVGAPADPGPAIGGCTTLRSATDGADVTIAATYVAPAGADESYWCGKVFGDRGYGSDRAVSGRPPAELTPDRGWLVVTRKQPLLREDIGCQHWSVLFCGNPFGKPVLGDLPA